jgi:hypothetical protein
VPQQLGLFFKSLTAHIANIPYFFSHFNMQKSYNKQANNITPGKFLGYGIQINSYLACQQLMKLAIKQKIFL